MKKLFLLATILVSMIGAPYASGIHLTPSEALTRLSSSRQGKALKRAETSLELTATMGNLYIFSDNNGYVVLPSDDAAPALLGYSEQCAFDVKSNPNLAYWLEFLNAEIDYLAQNPPKAILKSGRAERAAIAPMVATRWNQGNPYYNDCPVVNGTRCVTGCVATAMAQVLKYHNYPEKGTGTASYTWNSQELSFDYGNTTFEWDLMEDEYDSSSSEDSKAAVAKLMYGCGVSVKMDYSPSSSGALSQNIPGALIDNFNYDKAIWLAQRNAYGIDEWEDLIYNELRENRPVLYGGRGSGGGHEFVCDGYSNNGFFHFNWGWGGMSDGYFLLTALNPGSLGTGGGAGGYNIEQDAVIGVQPAKADSQPTYVIYNYEADFTVESETATKGSTVKFNGTFINFGHLTVPEMVMGIKLYNTTDETSRYVAGATVKNLPPNYYLDSYAVTLPEDLSDGKYTVTPAYRVTGQNWQNLHSFLNVTGKLNATVDGNTVTFSLPEKPTLSVENISTGEKIYIGRITPVSYTLLNPGSEEFASTIKPCLLDSEGKLTAQGADIPVDLQGGQSETYTDIAISFQAAENAEYTPGTYQLVFRDENGTNLNNPIEVTVDNAPTGTTTISVVEFKLVSANPIEDKSAVGFSVKVNCQAGYYTGTLRIAVFPDRSGEISSVYIGSTPYFYLNEGATETKTVDLNLSSLEDGKYFAMIYNGSTQANPTRAYFELKTDVVTGLKEIETDTDNPEIIYDLNGIRHFRPLIPGLYIINGVKTIVK